MNINIPNNLKNYNSNANLILSTENDLGDFSRSSLSEDFEQPLNISQDDFLNKSFNFFQMDDEDQPLENLQNSQNDFLNKSFNFFQMDDKDQPLENLQNRQNDFLNKSFNFFSIEDDSPSAKIPEKESKNQESTLPQSFCEGPESFSKNENPVSNFSEMNNCLQNNFFHFQQLNFYLNSKTNLVLGSDRSQHSLVLTNPPINKSHRIVIDLTHLEDSNEELDTLLPSTIPRDFSKSYIVSSTTTNIEQVKELESLNVKRKPNKQPVDHLNNKKQKKVRDLANSMFNGSLESNFYLNRKPWTRNDRPSSTKESTPIEKTISPTSEELENASLVPCFAEVFDCYVFENETPPISLDQLFQITSSPDLNYSEGGAFQNITRSEQQKNFELPLSKSSDVQKSKKNINSKEKKIRKKRPVVEIISYKKQKTKIEKKLRPALNDIYELNKKYMEIKVNFENDRYPKKPKGMVRELMPYQWRGYQWMKIFFKYGIGGCLADEMGLGKTIQSIALIQAVNNRLKKENKSAKILIACPAILIDNWANEISTCSPELGPKINKGKNGDIAIVSHSKLRSSLPEKKEGEILFPFDQKWDIVIIDECHMLVNGKPSKQAIELLRKKVSGPNRGFFFLTGTPLPNSLIELYQLNKMLNPDIFPNQPSFKKSFTDLAAHLFKSQVFNNSSKEQKQFKELGQRANELHEMLVKPFIMRRLKNGEEFKSQITIMQKGSKHIKPLASIESETNVGYSLSKQQSELINALSEIELNESSDNKKINKMISISTWIQQIASHPSSVFESKKLKTYIEKRHSHLIKQVQPFDEKTIEDGKLKSVVDVIAKIWQETKLDKILIFTNFEHTGNCLSSVIQNAFSNRLYINKVKFLSGKTKKEDRTDILEDFKQPHGSPVLVVARKLGSIGWNGTAANHIILVDPWWNEGDDSQCIARVHRIGQEKPVHVYRLHNKEIDVENRMWQFREEKKGWNELLLKGRDKNVEQIIEELYSNNISSI